MRSLLFAVALLANSAAAEAQFQCNEPTSNEWLNDGQSKGHDVPVQSSQVGQVSSDLMEAVSLLSAESAIRLDDRQVAEFTGRPSSSKGHKPFLIRAVFPTGNPLVHVSWEGENLFVFAEGLGCFAYTKHPIIVLLDRPPKRVFVSASAAL
jgi:hypothetical protein